METTSCACVISICYLRDGALAEDAAQETFVRAWRSREDFRGASSEKAWLTSIAVNVCRNMLRSPWHSRRGDLEILEREAADDTVIRTALGLPGKYREVVVLYYYQDCSTAEIAQALELPQGTVSIRLKRARERPKPALKEWYYAEY